MLSAYYAKMEYHTKDVLVEDLMRDWSPSKRIFLFVLFAFSGRMQLTKNKRKISTKQYKGVKV